MTPTESIELSCGKTYFFCTKAFGKKLGKEAREQEDAIAYISSILFDTHEMYSSSATPSTTIGINPWFAPQISLHCP